MLTKSQYAEARKRAIALYETAGIILTKREKEAIEVADFGLGDLQKIGLEVLVYMNTSRVCAKELAMFPEQTCPEHFHPSKGGTPGKEETFRCRWGRVFLYVPGQRSAPRMGGLEAYAKHLTATHEIVLEPGEQYTLLPDTLHWFRAGTEGAVVSEFSTTSTDDADIFTDPRIGRFTKIAES